MIYSYSNLLLLHFIIIVANEQESDTDDDFEEVEVEETPKYGVEDLEILKDNNKPSTSFPSFSGSTSEGLNPINSEWMTWANILY